jgi:hypothetical protein
MHVARNLGRAGVAKNVVITVRILEAQIVCSTRFRDADESASRVVAPEGGFSADLGAMKIVLKGNLACDCHFWTEAV